MKFTDIIACRHGEKVKVHHLLGNAFFGGASPPARELCSKKKRKKIGRNDFS